MDKLKEKIFAILVLIALGVIFIPMLFDTESTKPVKPKKQAQVENTHSSKQETIVLNEHRTHVASNLDQVKEQHPSIEVHKAETHKAETYKTEVHEAEAPKVEVPKVETHRVEAHKLEAPKVEVPKVETHHVEAHKAVENRIEIAKLDKQRIEIPKIDVSQVKVPKLDAHQIIPKTEPQTLSITKTETTTHNEKTNDLGASKPYISVYDRNPNNRVSRLEDDGAIQKHERINQTQFRETVNERQLADRLDEMQLRERAGKMQSRESMDDVQTVRKSVEHRGWVLQLGTFAEITNANRLIQQLREGGYPAFTKTVIRSGQDFTVVYVGPYVRKADPERLKHILESRFQLKGALVHHEIE